jgi:hypothetical protein
VEVFVDGLRSERKTEHAYPPSGDWRDSFDAKMMPALQYVAVPGDLPAHADRSGANPSLVYGRIERTTTQMTYRSQGSVTVYEWAIQAFDRYPDRPTRLHPGKTLGFDVAVVDKDRLRLPGDFTWGSAPPPFKGSDAGKLGELILDDDS